MSDKYERARLGILWYIMQFCVTMKFDGLARLQPGNHGFQNDSDHSRVRVGDLIAMTATPISKWYLSWVLEIKKGSSQFSNNYLCKSIETGELMWWRNVGMQFLDREIVEENPQWRWTDRQAAFADRWRKIDGGGMDTTLRPKFGDGFAVTLVVGYRYAEKSRPKLTKMFSDWRKVTKAMMAEFYNECVEARNNKKINGN